jgi:hypothetical protein
MYDAGLQAEAPASVPGGIPASAGSGRQAPPPQADPGGHRLQEQGPVMQPPEAVHEEIADCIAGLQVVLVASGLALTPESPPDPIVMTIEASCVPEFPVEIGT